ncbi:MAG: RHS repeat-associated core domain-containing protein [Fimbriimonadaceae bacterium]
MARTAGSSTTDYVFDQQGNVADRTDTSGAVQSVTQYDAWGNEQAISGTPSDPFGYNAQSGYYLDRETGLYLCQHRFYDPVGGIWLNRDPIGYGGGTNLYGYCAGGPVGGADRSGWLLVGAAGSLAGVAEGGAIAGVGATVGAGILAVGIGSGIGYAAGTGLDAATGGAWGHWWYDALGGADAPGELPAALLPNVQHDPDRGADCEYFIDPNQSTSGHTNDECVDIWNNLLRQINRLPLTPSNWRALRQQAFAWLANCSRNAMEGK